MKNLTRTINEDIVLDPIFALVDREGCFHLRQGDDHLAFSRKAAKKLRDALGELIELTMDKFRFSKAARATAIVAALGMVTIFYHAPGSLDHYKHMKIKHVKVAANQPVPPSPSHYQGHYD